MNIKLQIIINHNYSILNYLKVFQNKLQLLDIIIQPQPNQLNALNTFVSSRIQAYSLCDSSNLFYITFSFAKPYPHSQQHFPQLIIRLLNNILVKPVDLLQSKNQLIQQTHQKIVIYNKKIVDVIYMALIQIKNGLSPNSNQNQKFISLNNHQKNIKKKFQQSLIYMAIQLNKTILFMYMPIIKIKIMKLRIQQLNFIITPCLVRSFVYQKHKINKKSTARYQYKVSFSIIIEIILFGSQDLQIKKKFLVKLKNFIRLRSKIKIIIITQTWNNQNL
ncbi:unnamed protein product [Paramecium sonneborni]|uniref:Transmembrane protein n=1 Tax=Paramecium sonneborni TaxID=65129 RepID=A0A8S1KZM8_9CILI|nr:unnamed protein product [Paramecium sonneborni]